MHRKFDRTPFQFEELSPTEFEHCIAFLLKLDGYQAVVRGGTGDEGVDVEARNAQELLVVQCKKYCRTNSVGSQAIQVLFAAIHANQADKGLLVTTSSFTRQAKHYAQEKPIELLNSHKLHRWAKRHHIGPYFAPSPVLEARKAFYQHLCQRCGTSFMKQHTKGEDDFMDTLELTLKNITFDELLWLRSFAQKHQEEVAIQINNAQLNGGILDLEPRNAQAQLKVLSLGAATFDTLIELCNYFKMTST